MLTIYYHPDSCHFPRYSFRYIGKFCFSLDLFVTSLDSIIILKILLWNIFFWKTTIPFINFDNFLYFFIALYSLSLKRNQRGFLLFIKVTFQCMYDVCVCWVWGGVHTWKSEENLGESFFFLQAVEARTSWFFYAMYSILARPWVHGYFPCLWLLSWCSSSGVGAVDLQIQTTV